MMLAVAPIGVSVHLLLPHFNWFWTGLLSAVYLGFVQALLLRCFARSVEIFFIATVVAVFLAMLLAGGDIWDITFAPLAALALGVAQSLAAKALRPLPA
jgi:hypothetical protein